jgi:transcriptional regulator with XRE-family HTH domain
VEAGALIRRSRERAGLTQSELAARLGTTQSAVARLERPGSNPRIQTAERALLATGKLLSLSAKKPKSSVDETLIVDRLRFSPEQRLRSFEASYRDVRKLARSLA